MNRTKTINNTFLNDVLEGLQSNPKYLSSKYFYDEIGDKLFTEITQLDEYYLTRSEMEIIVNQTDKIFETIGFSKNTNFELIELGAGDGSKTIEILKFLTKNNFTFDYLPADISGDAINNLTNKLNSIFPKLSIIPKKGEHFEILKSLKNDSTTKLVLFLGSNLGNFSDQQAKTFINNLSDSLNIGDFVFLGLDLIKSKNIILPAYNDSKGVTSKFNLNLLNRINKELNANFDLESFIHSPEYNEEEGVAKSFIKSLKNQKVKIGEAENIEINFEKNEKIATEISRKYNDSILLEILKGSDFKIIGKLTDSKNYFADYILKKQ